MHTLTLNTSKTFGDIRILDNITLRCTTGEIIGIFGRNGCGKSTLMKIIFGRLRADFFSLEIDKVKILPQDIIASHKIAYLPQEPFLPKGMKVRDIIPMYYSANDQDKVFYAPNVHKISHIKAGNLSMGESRYLELLLVGNLDHPFLLLDEPFSMVEPLYKEHISELLLKLKASKGILITDHYYKDVLSIATKNIILKNGKAITVVNEDSLKSEGYLL